MITNSPVTVNDISVTLSSGTGSATANQYRTFLMIQAPAASAVTYSFTNSSPSAGATGCFTLAANSAPVIFGPNVPRNAIYLAGTGSAVVIIVEGAP